MERIYFYFNFKLTNLYRLTLELRVRQTPAHRQEKGEEAPKRLGRLPLKNVVVGIFTAIGMKWKIQVWDLPYLKKRGHNQQVSASYQEDLVDTNLSLTTKIIQLLWEFNVCRIFYLFKYCKYQKRMAIICKSTKIRTTHSFMFSVSLLKRSFSRPANPFLAAEKIISTQM